MFLFFARFALQHLGDLANVIHSTRVVAPDFGLGGGAFWCAQADANSNAGSTRRIRMWWHITRVRWYLRKVLRLNSALWVPMQFESGLTLHKQTVRAWCDKSLSMWLSIFLLHIPGESRCCEQQCDREGSERCHCTRFARGLTVTVPCGSLLVQGLQFTQFIAFSRFSNSSGINASSTHTCTLLQCPRRMHKVKSCRLISQTQTYRSAANGHACAHSSHFARAVSFLSKSELDLVPGFESTRFFVRGHIKANCAHPTLHVCVRG